ncbi:MAG: glycosyltransferase family 4 protein [Promethearchaeota archaeon]
MKIALIAFPFFPSKDGISHTLTDIYKIFLKNEENFKVFNFTYKNKNCYKILEQRKYSIKDFITQLKFKDFNYYLSILTLRLLSSKHISFQNKLKTIIYFLLKPSLLVKSINNIHHLYPYFKKFQFDIIIGGTSTASTQSIIFLLSKLFPLKVIYFAHGNEFMIHKYISLRDIFFKDSDKIIVHSNRLKKILMRIRNLPANKIEIIPPGLFPSDYKIQESKLDLRKKFDISSDNFVILSVGRQIKRKNFSLVIKALNELRKLANDAMLRYYLIGTGPETKNLKALVKRLKLEDNVFFLGNCDDITRNNFYKISDVFVMPSVPKEESIEGFGVVYLEANYFKLPVIGTFSGGTTEAIVDGVTGILVKQNDLGDLIDKLKYLYYNPEERKKLGENGYNRVINNFSWEILYKDYYKVFRDVLLQ